MCLDLIAGHTAELSAAQIGFQSDQFGAESLIFCWRQWRCIQCQSQLGYGFAQCRRVARPFARLYRIGHDVRFGEEIDRPRLTVNSRSERDMRITIITAGRGRFRVDVLGKFHPYCMSIPTREAKRQGRPPRFGFWRH